MDESRLSNFIDEHGIKFDGDLMYGNVHGYALSTYERKNTIELNISCSFENRKQKKKVWKILKKTDLKKYGVTYFGSYLYGVYIWFDNGPTALYYILDFIDWFVPLLKENAVTGIETCRCCKKRISSGSWYRIDNTAQYIHVHCAQKLLPNEERNDEFRKWTSHFTGSIGAFIGGLLGSFFWIYCYYSELFLSSAGAVFIGAMACVGYELGKGKQDKRMTIIVIVNTVLIVILVALGIYGYEVMHLNSSLAQENVVLSDILKMMVNGLENEEVRKKLLRDIGVGILSGLVGVWNIFVGVKYDWQKCRPEKLNM